ncbi:restriction endonuclease subunit S [Nocardia farcinica]|uniref:restriction endonuclease subunit S n=1 Tax=Nocardia farcinica TaxID=37329 RepID=UPI002458299F|nr:restriction endonuclease subunit S [Nocardia farcinica]
MSNWPLVPLGDILAQDGQTERIANTQSEKFLTIRLYGKGLVERSIGSGKTPKPFVGYRVKPGQFVYSRIDARNGAYGVVPDELDGAVCSKDFPKFDVDQQRADENYLLRLVQTRDFYRKVQDLSFGATNRQRVKEEEFLRLRIPLPPIEEQRRIAAILDHADALRAKRREALDRLDELTQSIFIDMFGDPIVNPRGYPIKPLQELIDPARPITYGILKPGEDVGEAGVKYVRVVDMKNGEILADTVRSTSREIAETYRRSRLIPGDLLMSIRGHVGRVAIVPDSLEGANITQDTARLAVVGASTAYVRECISTAGFRRWMDRHTKGVAVRGINLGDVKEMPIPVPEPEQQEEFARVVATVVLHRSTVRESLSAMEAEFASLQSRAFRGEL